MSHWNFRLLDVTDTNGGEPYIELIEAHYNDAGVPVGWTSPDVGSEDLEGMKQLLAWHALALTKPVMKKTDFVGEFEEEED